jgi:hypothetical protein
MKRRSLLAALVVVLLFAACGSATSQTSGAPGDGASSGDPCAHLGEFHGRCEEAIAIANARLGWLHWPITSTEIRDALCGPNMRCAMLLVPGVRSWVIFQFMVGGPVMVHVHLQEQNGEAVGDVLVADAPEPLPEWLLNEISATKG